MGCSASRLATSTVTGARTVDRNTYYDRHPGLHNKPTDGIVSVVARRIQARKRYYGFIISY